MLKNTPTPPSHTLFYWKPWKEDADFISSWMDYKKDVSLAKYTADSIGQYITQSNDNQINAINEIGKKIGGGFEILSKRMSQIDSSLFYLARKMDLQIEQQKISNVLLQNIVELLKLPDNEKLRQQHIERGLKFFINAGKDEDFFNDALDELLEAEKIMKQDYFVLHRIGLIYLHSKKHINPKIALDYFLRAGKYSLVENDSHGQKLATILFNNELAKLSNSVKAINLLRAESFEKAAFCNYILGKNDKAIEYQKNAKELNPSFENHFTLSKYYARINKISECLISLKKSIKKNPIAVTATLRDLDLLNIPEVIDLINWHNDEISIKIRNLIENCEAFHMKNRDEVIIRLNCLNDLEYHLKVQQFNVIENEIKEMAENRSKLVFDLEKMQKELDSIIFKKNLENEKEELKTRIDNLLISSSPEFENSCKEIFKIIESKRLKIGDKFAGGICFYIDKLGKSGYIVAENDLGISIWGNENLVDTSKEINSGTINTNNIIRDGSFIKKLSLFSYKNESIITAATLCNQANINGYKGWVLPSLEEMKLIFNNLYKLKVMKFKSTSSPRNSTDYGFYWTSSQVDSSDAYACGLNIYNDKTCHVTSIESGKKMEKFVLPIRHFSF